MVSGISIICVMINILICFCIPVGIFVFLLVKRHNVVKPFFIGMAVFIVVQLLTRIPMLNFISYQQWFINLSTNPWLYGVFLGVTAALFETIGRFIAFRFLLKKNQSFQDGIAYGIGHGGIEAMILVGIANINNLLLMLAINSGGFELMTKALPAATAEIIYNQLTGISAGTFILAGVERLFVFVIQVGLSLLVLYAVKYKQNLYLWLALLIHTLIDASVVILPTVFNMSTEVLEIIIGVIAIIMFIGVYKKRNSFGSVALEQKAI